MAAWPLRAAMVVFGVLFTLLSGSAAYSGYAAGTGWLAIVFGALTVSMGVAAIAAVFVRPQIAAGFLLGWSLVGAMGSLVIEFGAYASVWLVVPLVLLTIAMIAARSGIERAAAAGGGLVAVLALAGLIVIAPALPPLCPSSSGGGQSFPSGAVIPSGQTHASECFIRSAVP